MQPDGHTNSTGGNAVNPRGITQSARSGADEDWGNGLTAWGRSP